MEVSQAITRKSASNLALAFVLLPKPKRLGMSALYAFCREVDDLADSPQLRTEEKRARLDAWRQDIRIACQGGDPQIVVNRELQPYITQYHLSFEYFDEIVRGVEMDLDIKRYADYAQLEQYCYRVASAVGLLSIEIFGYQHPRCRDYAIYLGQALQLTNILRDVRMDALDDRIYLPLDELRRCGVDPEEILRLEYSPRFQQAAQSLAQRARCFYQRAQTTLPPSDRRSMVAAELMGSVYWRLLQKLEAQGFNVFGPKPTRLGKLDKLRLVLRTWYGVFSGALAPAYGTH